MQHRISGFPVVDDNWKLVSAVKILSNYFYFPLGNLQNKVMLESKKKKNSFSRKKREHVKF